MEPANAVTQDFLVGLSKKKPGVFHFCFVLDFKILQHKLHRLDVLGEWWFTTRGDATNIIWLSQYSPLYLWAQFRLHPFTHHAWHISQFHSHAFLHYFTFAESPKFWFMVKILTHGSAKVESESKLDPFLTKQRRRQPLFADLKLREMGAGQAG